METLRWLLGTKPHPLAYVEGDIVYPTHMPDNIDSIRELVIGWTMCFNDVLDADKLHASLCRLLELGDWRKLGGRLRLPSDGGRMLEMHVPPTFTPERPAVAYTHETMGMRIAEHPLARELPRPTGRQPSFWRGPDDFRVFASRPGVPETVEDFATQDVPMLSLHVTSFGDTTLVALSYPHTMMDAMGQGDLLRAWSLVLAGKESDVPPLLGAREDVLYRAGAEPDVGQPREEFVLESKAATTLGMIKFGLRMMWDIVWERKLPCQTIFLPRRTVEYMRARALQELEESAPEGAAKPWVSEGDVLLGFFAHKSALIQPPGRPMSMISPMDGRGRLGDLVSKDGVYIQNMQLGCSAPLSAEQARGSGSELALAYRQALEEQASPGQALAYCRYARKMWDARSPIPLFGSPDMTLFVTTNWARANLLQAARFGPAVVRASDTGEGRTNPPGEMVFQHAQPLRPSIFARNVLAVLGKNHEGGYWLTGYFKPQMWELVREAVNAMEY